MNTAVKSSRIIDLIGWGVNHFTKKGIENARFEMEWLICHILAFKRINLYLNFEKYIEQDQLNKLRSMVKRRISGEPLQHIIGKAPFYGRDFIVNSNVFIPRPETGILIDRLKENGGASNILEVGTGSGCIAITCSLENLSENIYATDISSDVIKVSHENMMLHKVDNIQFACHDFLNDSFKTRFDVILSNPPYVGINEMESLQVEVRDYDPKIALTDGSDGSVFYRHFCKKFDELIDSGGYMLLEIGGNTHKGFVEKIFSDAGLKTTYFRDLQDDFRVVEVRK